MINRITIRAIEPLLGSSIKMKRHTRSEIKGFLGVDPIMLVFSNKIAALSWDAENYLVNDKDSPWHLFTRKRIIQRTDNSSILYMYKYREQHIGFAFALFDNVWGGGLKRFDMQGIPIAEIELYYTALFIDAKLNRNKDCFEL